MVSLPDPITLKDNSHARTENDEMSRPNRHGLEPGPDVFAEDVVLERDGVRQRDHGKVAYRSGETDPDQLDTLLATTPQFGLWLDTSRQTPDETVQSILDQWSEAAVDSNPLIRQVLSTRTGGCHPSRASGHP